MVEKLRDILKVPDYDADELAWQSTSLKRILIFIFAVSALRAYLLAVNAQQDPFWQSQLIIIILANILLFSGTWWLRRRGGVWLAAFGFISSAFILLGLLLLTEGFPDDAIAIPYFFMSIVASLFLGWRAVQLFTFLGLILFALSSLFKGIGIGLPQVVGSTDFNYPEMLIVIYGLFSIYLSANIRRAERRSAALQLNQQRYRTLFEHAPNGIWEQEASEVVAYLDRLVPEVDGDLRSFLYTHPEHVWQCMQQMKVFDVSESAVSMYQAQTKADLMDNIGRILPEDPLDFLIDSLICIANRERSFTCETQNKLLNGKVVDILFRWTVFSYDDPHQVRVFVSVVDISAQKHAENAQRRLAERLRILHQLDLSILEAHSLKEVAESALDYLQQLVPLTEVGLAVFDHGRDSASLVARRGDRELLIAKASADNQELLQQLSQGDHLLFNDVAKATHLSPAFAQMYENGGRSLLITPLNHKQGLVGSLLLAADEVDAFGAEHIVVARQMAAPLGIAIHNAQLLEAEQTAIRRTETLRQTAEAFNENLVLEDVLDLIVAWLPNLLGNHAYSVMLLADKGLYLATQQGNPAIELMHLSEDLPAWQNIMDVIRHKRPRLIADTQSNPQWQPDPAVTEVGSWLGVPLLAQDRAIGLLNLDHHQPDFFVEEDIKWVQAFANQAALAIENARLFREVQLYGDQMERRVNERSRELAALYEVSAVLAESSDMDIMLQEAILRIIQVLSCDACVIHLLDKEQGKLVISTSGGLDTGNVDPAALPNLNPLLDIILASQKPLIATRETLPSFPRGSHFGTFVTYLGAPMRAQGDLTGVLSVMGSVMEQFAPEEVTLVGSIADQIGIAIENARLRDKARSLAIVEERNRLSRDLHDSVTQSLYSLTLFAEAARDQVEERKLAVVQEHIDTISDTAQQALKEMRLLLYELREPVLGHLGLIEAIRTRLDMVEKRSRIHSQLEVSNLGEIPSTLADGLFLVANEALNNALKHADAYVVNVRLHRERDTLILEVQDDGIGFDPGGVADKGGLGLQTMNERVRQMEGSLQIESSSDIGTCIRVLAPIAEAVRER